MDTKTLIADAKARFSHNSAKAYLKDKFDSKLIIADQGGLWKATPNLISFLNSMDAETIVLIDNFDNPVKVVRATLLANLKEVYTIAMSNWYTEWTTLENKR
jgi:hypothetical protein